MHEQSRTVEMDGRHYIIHGKTGAILEGPFLNAESAESRAQLRSQDPLPGLEMSDPSYTGPRRAPTLTDQVFPAPALYTPPAAGRDLYGPLSRPLGDPEAIEPRAWGRQAGPGRREGLLGLFLDFLLRSGGAAPGGRPPISLTASRPRSFTDERTREG